MTEILLRKLQLDDAEPMLEWMLDPDIYSKMQYDHKNMDIEKCLLFIRNSWSDKHNLHWAVSDISQKYMGTISLKNIDYKNKNAEFGIAIHPMYMGKGIASRALQKLVEKVFLEMDLNKIYLYVRTDNERAVSFYKRNHLEFEGCAKEHLLIENDYKDILWFSLRRKNYKKWKSFFE